MPAPFLIGTKKNQLIFHSILICCFTFFLGSCAINPATGTPDLVLMGKDKEISIGKEMHEKILQSTPIYEEEPLNSYVKTVGQKMAKVSDRPELEYHFTIIDSPDINAFALPGGYVYINRGLLAYMKTEAQLAAVLGHEIAHITARHAVRQKTAAAGAGVLSVLSVLATGSGVVGDITSLWSTAAVMGYGREMELEADSFGAKYLVKAQYNPNAMVEVIGILKDHESFSRRQARDSGKKPKVYHGVFSTHPRNDKRLQEAVANAGELPQEADINDNAKTFREMTEGMLYGKNYNKKKKNDKNEFLHSKLGFSILFPKDWKVENKRSAIVAAPEKREAQLSLEVSLLKKPVAPDDFLNKKLGLTILKRSEPLKQYGLIGHTGITPENEAQKQRRVAVLFQGRRAYTLTGQTFQPKEDVDYDDLFLTSIKSFRPKRVSKPPKAQSVHWVKANQKTTFKGLANFTKLGKYSEQYLRVLNGYYPRGEPKPGDWIKIVQQSK